MTVEKDLAPEMPSSSATQSSQRRRAATIAVALPIVLLFVWLGGWFLFALLTFVLCMMTMELRSLMIQASHRPVLWFSFALALFLLASAMFPQQRLMLLSIGTGLALLLSFPLFFMRAPEQRPLNNWGLTLGLALYQGWPLSCMLLLRGATLAPWPLMADMWNYIPPGVWWLCLALLGAWSTDTGAFHIGKAFGICVHPLLPRISPGKNLEGLIGGTIFATVTCLLIGSLLLHLPWYLCLLLGVILGPCALAGDLSESLIKREAHAKDSGTIMPGHGGILDRCDSILFGVIVVYTFMLIIS